MRGILNAASDSTVIHENAYWLLQLMDQEVLDPIREDGYAFATRHAEVLIAIWNATCAREIQLRMRHDLRKVKRRLVSRGMAVDQLDAPEWLGEDEETDTKT